MATHRETRCNRSAPRRGSQSNAHRAGIISHAISSSLNPDSVVPVSWFEFANGLILHLGQ